MPAAVNVIKVGEWRKAGATLKLASTMMGKLLVRALHAEGNDFAAAIRSNIKYEGARYGQKFKALAKNTLAAANTKAGRKRKSKKPLQHTLKMISMIKVYKRGRRTIFVGIHKNAKATHGAKMYRAAEVLEKGKDIYINTSSVSRAYLRFLGHLFSKKGGGQPKGGRGKGVIHIRIPPRPFLEPTYQALYGNPAVVKKRMELRLEAYLKLANSAGARTAKGSVI